VLQIKGWVGPGVCKLCNKNVENANHLFIHCPFTKAVWSRLTKVYNLKIPWAGSSISDCLIVWNLEKSVPVSLAAITCWQIWIERNKVLFEDHTPSYIAVVHRIAVTFSWQSASIKPTPNRVCGFIHIEGFTLACFDGAAQLHGVVLQRVDYLKLILRGSPNGTSTT